MFINQLTRLENLRAPSGLLLTFMKNTKIAGVNHVLCTNAMSDYDMADRNGKPAE